jgi:outer membrane scaffolding protein for murein synthesis (MipA/OmpV family)
VSSELPIPTLARPWGIAYMQEAKAEDSVYIGGGVGQGPAYYRSRTKETDGAYSSCKVIGSGGHVVGVIRS